MWLVRFSAGRTSRAAANDAARTRRTSHRPARPNTRDRTPSDTYGFPDAAELEALGNGVVLPRRPAESLSSGVVAG